MCPFSYARFYINMHLLIRYVITHHLCLNARRSILLAIIVEKSKKCLDFSVTLFLIHIVLCSIYGGFPSTWDWWIIHILGMICMTVLGEYFCSKRELSDIPLLVI